MEKAFCPSPHDLDDLKDKQCADEARDDDFSDDVFCAKLKCYITRIRHNLHPSFGGRIYTR